MYSDDSMKTSEVFAYTIRIHVCNGEFLSVPANCNSIKPPMLVQILESNCGKFTEFRAPSTGNVYGYIKRYEHDWNEFFDLEPEYCSRTPVRPKDKLQLWYTYEKKHPHAILLTKKKDSAEVDKHVLVHLVSEIHLQITAPDVPLSFTEIVEKIGAEHNVLAGCKRYPREMFGWITKNLGQGNYVEAHLDAPHEPGATYQIHFAEMRKGGHDSHFLITDSDSGELHVIPSNNRCHEDERQKEHDLFDMRLELESNCSNEQISQEVTLSTSPVFVTVFKDNEFVVNGSFALEPRTPFTFQDLVLCVDKKYNLVEKHDVYLTHAYALISKVCDNQRLVEVDLDGVVEAGMRYHVSILPCSTVEDSRYRKLHYSPIAKRLEFRDIVAEGRQYGCACKGKHERRKAAVNARPAMKAAAPNSRKKIKKNLRCDWFYCQVMNVLH